MTLRLTTIRIFPIKENIRFFYLERTSLFISCCINENKIHKPISSNSHHSETANKTILLQMRGGGVTKPTGTSYNFDKVWKTSKGNLNLMSVIKFTNINKNDFITGSAVCIELQGTNTYGAMDRNDNTILIKLV